MIRFFFLTLVLIAALANPAAAHKLKVFAAVKGDAVAGYAFFVGGGRAKGTPWIAKDANGTVIATGETDAEGNFRLVPPRPVVSDIIITVDTREGHIASAVIAATRFGALPAAAAPAPSPKTVVAPDQAGATGAAQLSKDEVAALVEAAVQRQVEPLLERIEQMDDRLRFTDILSGIFLIIGLAGMGLWARARR